MLLVLEHFLRHVFDTASLLCRSSLKLACTGKKFEVKITSLMFETVNFELDSLDV